MNLKNRKEQTELIKKNKRIKVQNDVTATVFEYPQKSKRINGATTIIQGRYPTRGFVVNHQSDELAYILKGKGKLIEKDGETYYFSAQDILIIPKNIIYAWEGSFKALLVSVPAWTPEQHETII